MQRSVLIGLLAGLAAWPVAAIENSVPETPLSAHGQQTGSAESGSQPQADMLAAEQARQQTEDIIAASGLEGLSEQARNLAQQVLNETQAPLGFQYDVVDRLATQWAPDALQTTLAGALAALNDQQREQLRSTLNSRRLQNARSKELSAIADQDNRSYQDYISRLRQQPPAAARVALIQQLDEAMQFSALLSVTRSSVYPQLQAVLRDWQPPQNWQAGLQRDVTEFLLYVHRTTPNDELQRLVQAYREPVLQQWLAGVKKSLSHQAG
ncbi:MAG: hypothetical protein LRY66_09000 [Saccharospirillaceae bacterium]|nr:hypothetical protein [Saccharospirillaceae bacterium]MCD8531480.1 hypothetical protein [Saccharospirillaceae bacterium]